MPNKPFVKESFAEVNRLHCQRKFAKGNCFPITRINLFGASFDKKNFARLNYALYPIHTNPDIFENGHFYVNRPSVLTKPVNPLVQAVKSDLGLYFCMPIG